MTLNTKTPRTEQLISIAATVVSNYIKKITANPALTVGTKVISNVAVKRTYIHATPARQTWKNHEETIYLSELSPLLIDGEYVIPAKPRNLSGAKKHMEGIVVDLGGVVFCLYVRKDDQIRILLDQNIRKSMETFEVITAAECMNRQQLISYRKEFTAVAV